MPIYQFTCPKCGHAFDEILPMSRSHESAPCPKCGETKTSRDLTTCAPPSSARSSSSGGGCSPRSSFG